MNQKTREKRKRLNIHPITAFIILIILTLILSKVLSIFGVYGAYSKMDSVGTFEKTIVSVEDLITYDGFKNIVGNAVRNFISTSTLSTLIISLIGLSIAKATGLLDTFINRKLVRIDNKWLTFIVILFATISSLINEIGFVILIPLAAIIYMANNRNPLAGITAAFCGVAFGYGATIFVGSMEVDLNPITESAAKLIDVGAHISLTSNLYIIIVSTIVLSIVGTIIIEKIILPRLGKYKAFLDLNKTLEIERIDEDEEIQKRLEREIKENKGLKYAFFAFIICLLFSIYALIPNLPFSGLLLDMKETTYLKQVFGANAYLQDGFNILVSLILIIVGLAYGYGAKTITSDRDLFENANEYLMQTGNLIGLLFVGSQFISIFKASNIGTVIAIWMTDIITNIPFSGIPLIVVVLLLISISNLFATTPVAKWAIMAPVVVPKLMQNNVSPQFAQFILRAGESMTKGITPLLAYFVIYVGYLNLYNPNKKRTIGIIDSLRIVFPYFLIISLTWILIVVLWYIIGLPIGPKVLPTL